jgi:hypothetical protein
MSKLRVESHGGQPTRCIPSEYGTMMRRWMCDRVRKACAFVRNPDPTRGLGVI